MTSLNWRKEIIKSNNNNTSSFEVPAIVSGKNAKFIVNLDHDVLHHDNGKVFDMNFYRDLCNKFNNLLPFKDELSHVNGSPVTIHSFDDESFLNIFTDLIKPIIWDMLRLRVLR